MSQTYERQNPAFYALLAVLVFMSIGPVLLMLVNSFKLDVDITSGTTGLLFLPTIQNYETALCDVLWYELEHLDYCSLKFGGAFINSLIIALISTVLTLVIGCMAAYALVRFRFMGRDTASLTTLMVRMVPPAVLLVPVFGLWNNEFCIDKTTWVGSWIREVFGGARRCLPGRHPFWDHLDLCGDESALRDLDSAEFYRSSPAQPRGSGTRRWCRAISGVLQDRLAAYPTGPRRSGDLHLSHRVE